MDGNDNGFIKNRDKEKQRQNNEFYKENEEE